MNYEGKFKLLTKEQIVRFLELKSVRELKIEKGLSFLQERSVKY